MFQKTMNKKLGKNGNQKLELELPKKKREKSQESQHNISFPGRPASTESDLPMVSPWPRGHYSGEILPVDGTLW
jgi:hypothetical protein